MINESLRLLRVFHDLKAIDLAKKLSISQSYLSEIENGKKKPSLELIEKYSEVFRIKPSTILFFSEEIDQNSLKGNMKELMIRFMKIIERFGGLEDE
ncbi:helix-turn-helix domain-containing protein [Clostridium beijerinckii]|uniref:Transcriptional regulator with XRE-family HTH domain n=1 Tax=Clostridium beijerinckii TaxID=1520 RepID=A0A9Q5D6N2_CLOBE|nr:helix-turn-helix transcriptional regulator [Clostridium beijerinckii]AQS03994.1 helix-turn-helix domain protein [Clostridium beijerinckii]MBA2884123.1 transcriptional regulator with XRE-family HTH domain [Clostridium beijerinckii]MBA2899306.1 transcriptional regulator with XRE-family HTH domain [Clostridium beijerinckii]MBA2908708.1 transcriptional regulator with XRE-family HTH domain [Clostridium beijerinckii]MBA9016460.1 transcriptional regulator with XRE-family HTH domain [Clostridium be